MRSDSKTGPRWIPSCQQAKLPERKQNIFTLFTGKNATKVNVVQTSVAEPQDFHANTVPERKNNATPTLIPWLKKCNIKQLMNILLCSCV
jgi:hypothetical protein